MTDIFSLPDFNFPPGFWWGSATAGYQTEGEVTHAHLYPKEQAGEFAEPSGRACDSWNRLDEDLAMLQTLGHNTYRFSLEWSRIEPREGERDEAALRRYLDFARALKAAGIRVVLTVVHGAHPLWFEEKGGFGALENLPLFERHVALVAEKFAGLVEAWIVLNEFNLSSKRLSALYFRARGYHTIKKFSDAPVSSAHAYQELAPLRPRDELDQLMTRHRDFVENEFFFHAIRTGEVASPHTQSVMAPEIQGTADFWAIQYYTRFMVDGRQADGKGKPFDALKLQMIDLPGFYLEEFFPEGLFNSCLRLRDKPIIITENGVCADNDEFRLVFLVAHLSMLHHAIGQGCDVRGYLHWSLLDNWEWGTFKPRFGLVSVDRNTFARTVKPSGHLFREIIQHNGYQPEMIARYLKQMPRLSSKPSL